MFVKGFLRLSLHRLTRGTTKRGRSDEGSGPTSALTEGGTSATATATASGDEMNSGGALACAADDKTTKRGRSDEGSGPTSALTEGGTAAAATADEMDGVEKAKGAEDEFADLWRLLGSPTGPGDANFETEVSASAFDERHGNDGKGRMDIGGCLTNVDGTAGIPGGQLDDWMRGGTAFKFAPDMVVLFIVPGLPNSWTVVRKGGIQATVWCQPMVQFESGSSPCLVDHLSIYW